MTAVSSDVRDLLGVPEAIPGTFKRVGQRCAMQFKVNDGTLWLEYIDVVTVAIQHGCRSMSLSLAGSVLTVTSTAGGGNGVGFLGNQLRKALGIPDPMHVR